MVKMTAVKLIVLTAMCIALCVVLPLAFHMIPNAGSILLPMHIPVLLCGLICGAPFGLVCGVLGPLLSSLFTGMPPITYLPGMVVELAVYGLAAGLLMKLVHTKKLVTDVYISLIGAMLAGRIAGGLVSALIFMAGKYSFAAWAGGYFITCWPGLIIQLALIPPVVLALERANLVPVRYRQVQPA